MDAATIALLAVVVLIAFTTEATAGFGSLLIALTLGSLFLPTEDVLTIAVPLEVGLATYLVLRHRLGVAWRLLMAQILPLMLAGGAVGFLVSSSLSGSVMKKLLGGMVVVFAAQELWRLALQASIGRPLPSPIRAVVIAAAGFVHGIFATGGPLLVYAVGRSKMAKTELRSTLATVWLILNSVLSATFLASGRIDTASSRLIALFAPLVILAIVLGEILHHRIPERPFRLLVFALLLLAGLLILLR